MFELTGVEKRYRLKKSGKSRELIALAGVDLTLERGETLGLVGESGCGKSTLAKLMVRMERPSSGSISFETKELSTLTGEELKRFRRSVQMIFQDPYGSLNPKMKVADIVAEPILVHNLARKTELANRTGELLEAVGLAPGSGALYPSRFSGGQRQRIAIARALASNPGVIIADEPVSALDTSVQAQVLNLLAEVKHRWELALLFISHDLKVVSHIADRVAVMYLGHVVEIGTTREVLGAPKHPYTRGLISAIPTTDTSRRGERASIYGEVPSPIDRPPGCPFEPRCSDSFGPCINSMPEEVETGPGHGVKCHLFTGIDGKT